MRSDHCSWSFIKNEWILKWQVRFLIVCLYVAEKALGDVRYSIEEEMPRGSFVGNIEQDLGLNSDRLVSGKGRIVTLGSAQYIELDVDKGILLVKERIDREQLCAQLSPCSFGFEIVLEKPLELYSVLVEIIDINDNAPSFPKNEIQIEIMESASSGTRFLLENAVDLDVGANGLQSYSLKPTDNFHLKVHNRPDGRKYVEMVLQTPLDREKQSKHTLILTAVDGGRPQKSGIIKINIIVQDVNDNAPVFTQSIYKAAVLENSVKGTLIAKVNATDVDEGSYGEVTYSFTHIPGSSAEMFQIDAKTGEIKVIGSVDYETAGAYEVNIQARDQGGLTDACTLVIEVIDANDNSPQITLTSFSGAIPEDAVAGTVVALINVQDADSGKNGQTSCSIDPALPFKIKSSIRNYYTLVTDTVLDREEISEYSIVIIARDEGSPSLSTNKTILLKVSDINDNAPHFDNDAYAANIIENNFPGLLICTVHARDLDWNQNARVSYYINDVNMDGISASAYVSVHSDSGTVHAVRALDYEQIKVLQVTIIAKDGGYPPMSSNVTLRIFVQDQNDNTPQILYPVHTDGALVAEMVPRSADVGYLVTKVVAVDADSGQNAWLSYKLLKATDKTLFEVGLQNGEIRTLRQVTDKDAVKQRLVVVVEDNGQPSRSATVNVNVAVADSFPEVLSEFGDFSQDKGDSDNLTFYLILSLAVITLLFIASIIFIITVKMYKWRQTRLFHKSHGNLPVIPSAYYPPHFADIGASSTLQRVYNYETCLTTDSRKSEFKIARTCSEGILSDDQGTTGAMTQEQQEKGINLDSDVPLEVSLAVWISLSIILFNVCEFTFTHTDVFHLFFLLTAVFCIQYMYDVKKIWK